MIIGVTGVTGNLGRRMLQYFLQRFNAGDEIRCLVRTIPSTGFNDKRIVWLQGDLSQSHTLEQFTRGLDICVHLASLVGFATAAEYHAVNVAGTALLCEMLHRHAPACRLVHCSSIAVLRRNQRFTWLNTDYANSKFAADQVVKNYRGQQGLSANIVYPGLIYGPEDKNFIPTLGRYLKKGVVFFIRGGEQHCPAVFIDDLCELFWQIITKIPASGRDFIGVGRQECGVHGFIRTLAQMMQVTKPSTVMPKWLLMPLAIVMDKLYQIAGKKHAPMISMRSVDLLSINLSPQLVAEFNRDFWSPRMTMHTGLRHSLRWCQEQKLL
ncbi:MAG: NAD-dependent epimerase/dehydratase family protein [Moraxellaceae bacterium]|nr:MAG: NAD-dependent epimerase/dehydratase family protein [Moraxellaceae bacterium]